MAKRKKLSERQQKLLDEVVIEKKKIVVQEKKEERIESELFLVNVYTNFGNCKCYHRKRVQDDTKDEELIQQVRIYLLGKKSTAELIIYSVDYITNKVGLQ